MEGKDAIITKIIDDANQKASSIIDNAKFEGSLLVKEAENWATQYVIAQEEELKKTQKEIVFRRKTVAELDVRKNTLQKKQEFISSIIDKVYVELTKLNKTEYLSFVEKNICSCCDENDVIVLSKDNVLTKEDLASLKIVKEKKLTIDEKLGEFTGGVYLVGKISDKDLTFKSIIERQKDLLISQIAEKLF